MKNFKNIAVIVSVTASILTPVAVLAKMTTFDCSASSLHKYLLAQRMTNKDAKYYTHDILPIQNGKPIAGGCNYTNVHYYLHKKNQHLSKFNSATAQWLSNTLSAGYPGVGKNSKATTGACTLKPKDQWGYPYYNCTNIKITN